ncbi:MAG: hypothetical protein PVH29_08725 [Candidatus Zixiibacteriota bacterium]|jgi:hypothetical protein
MKSFLVVLVAAVLAFATLAYGEANPQPSPGKKETSIKLTADQAKQVAGARGEVEINLTKSQLTAIEEVVDYPGGPTSMPRTLTLGKKYVGRDNVVRVMVAWDAKGRVSVEPIPTP